MKKSYLLLATAIVLMFANCSKDKRATTITSNTPTFASHTAARSVYAGFPETFESGSKGAYAAADVTLSTGTWNLNDALIGTSASDRKNGSKAVRVENTGIVSQQFDMASGAYQVSVATGVYGTDASSTWGLWYSTNSGSTWTQVGSTITTSSTTLTTTTFSMDITSAVRFQIRKLSGERLNIDDISITDDVTSGGGATRDDNMGMGNPSNATTDVANPSNATTDVANTNNYLMVKTQYALSYNNSKGMANWVSWHLSTAWKGTATRCDCFTQDASLPSGYFKATTSNYTNTGFDRGHMCPSEDRDGSATDNAATFLMTNITPQAPILNENVWESLEAYCRTLITSGYELYIISGGYGTGGSGSLGGTTNSIASGAINVPSHFWKVIVVLPIGTSDASRVSTSTRVIAVDMPNQQTVNAHTWGYYRTSVDAIESATGYDFLSNVSTSVQSVVEAAVDNGPTN